MRENELIQMLVAATPATSGRVEIPLGDDMALMRLDGPRLLLAVDQLLAGVHFDPVTTRPGQIGRKALARNLSDIAAMAAEPRGALLSLLLPPGTCDTFVREIFAGLRELGDRFGCPLLGGDTTIAAGPLLLSVSVFAEPAGVEPVRRCGARPGDRVFVSGFLGGSLERIDGYTHHLDFEPRLALARALAGSANTAWRPQAMMDLSDGLAMDLPRLCAASGVRARVDLSQLPIGPAGRQAAMRSGRPNWVHAAGDGEDYELLWTAAEAPAMLAGVPITCIGEVVPQEVESVDLPMSERVDWEDVSGARVSLVGLGWEHGA